MLIEMILVPVIALFILFILTKIMGYRQISQLSMYDYINGMTIGSIAAELIVKGYEEFLRPTIGMAVCAGVIVFLSILSNKSRAFRYVVEGRAIILYKDDVLYNQQLNKAKMDVDEFLMQCRIKGYFNLNEIDTVILETNGQLSVLPKEQYRPTVLDDLNVTFNKKSIPYILIQETTINEHNLKLLNKDHSWIERVLKAEGKKLKDVILMQCTLEGEYYFYYKNNNEEIYI